MRSVGTPSAAGPPSSGAHVAGRLFCLVFLGNDVVRPSVVAVFVCRAGLM